MPRTYAALSFTPDMFTGARSPSVDGPRARYESRGRTRAPSHWWEINKSKPTQPSAGRYHDEIPSVKALSNHGRFNNTALVLYIQLPLFLSYNCVLLTRIIATFFLSFIFSRRVLICDVRAERFANPRVRSDSQCLPDRSWTRYFYVNTGLHERRAKWGEGGEEKDNGMVSVEAEGVGT